MADPDETESEPGFAESLSRAAAQSGFAKLAPGEELTGRALLGAIGGIRGILESILPGAAFLAIFLPTHVLWLSVLVPVVIGVIFLVVRLATKSAPMSAITGLVLLAISAVLAVITNKAITNFVPGMVINAIGFVVMLVSLAVRWPIVGVVVGILYGDSSGWREDRRKRRALVSATWLWVGLFAVRLAIELPLYFANDFAALGIVRIITSVPLYAVVLWASWLLVRGAYAGERVRGLSSGDDLDT